jgi:hypothetical protein
MKFKSYTQFINEKANMKKVFLGGTCNNSLWRDDLIKKLKIEYFNPVVKDWTPECQEEEIKQRNNCDYCLYVITPLMLGVYSVAEVADDSNKRPEKTIFCYLTKDGSDKSFNESQIKSLDQVGKMIKSNGGQFLKTLDEVADFLNK